MVIANQNMEKRKGSSSPSRKEMKTNLCIPRLHRSSNNHKNKTNKPLTPMTLLGRFREAVFRLIMISALSKAATAQNDHYQGQTRLSSSSSCHVGAAAARSYYNPADPHHSEAVADCIEFIKKKALTVEGSSCDDQSSRDSTSASSSIYDAATSSPVPVM